VSGHSLLLRVSSRDGNGEVALDKVTGEEGVGTGVPRGDALVRLVDATVNGDDAALAEARQAVVDAVGAEGLVDAAGVIGAFTMQNRVADATGLPLDAPIEMATRRLRAELDVDGYGASAYTERGWVRAFLARLAEPLLPLVLKALGRRQP